ncbi:phage terminase small subunit [Altericroceibacterium endophyticum]|uniref:Terminase n=1 Tax=Altericroceibacterium endophyticum TaxID=1808508 RepID=A0A6I4T1K3_9SPHN|nr:phage terminase small subunit [Altericroceibacterium endophyticum]MXO64837.1 terminase [Altericroceibacterium endophyticum]
MISPFRRHQQKTLARLSAYHDGQVASEGMALPMPEDSPGANEYRNLLAQQHEDLRRLSEIESIENKIAAKAEMLPKYTDWCEGALAIAEGDSAPQDDIVVTAMIWALDVRQWTLALDLAQHVITHSLQMPERYHRGSAGLVVSEVADAAIADPEAVPHDVLLRAKLYLNARYDMKDSYRARLHRALGESWARKADDFDPDAEDAIAGGKPALVDTALTELRRAKDLDGKVGVVKQIEALEREAKRLAKGAEDAADKSQE